MRSEGNRYPFDVYLSLVKLSPQDVEDVNRATVEMDITCKGKQFIFHCPVGAVESAGVQVASLPPKEWVAPSDFHHAQYVKRQRENTISSCSYGLKNTRRKKKWKRSELLLFCCWWLLWQ